MRRTMMTILALDLGTTTGWALAKNGTLVQSGVWSFKPRRFEGGGMRYLRFEASLDEIHRLTPLAAVYVEEVRRHRGVDAAHAYGGFLATVTRWCEAQEPKVAYDAIPVGTIKKHALGKGGGKGTDKDAMVEAARSRGWEPVDHNEADALWLLDLVLNTG